MDTKLSRRSFVTGATGAAVIAASGMAQVAAADEPMDSPAGSWKIAPEPIGDDQIAETFEADLVIVGAGAAGCIATATAVEDGASVILLQKDEEPFCHGYAFAANGTAKQKEAGVEVDGWEVMNAINLMSENKAKTEVIRNWVKYSGEMCDWLASKIDDVEGVGPIMLEIPEPADDEWNYTYTVTHLPVGNFTPIGSVPPVIKYLISECDPGLLDAHYSTPAVQLRREEGGRVTGVVAQREDGSYILCNAKKGVILAAGDYGNDIAMRDELMPYAIGLPAGYATKSDTGDGHKMAVWIGAAMEPAPHACNIHYDPELKYPNYQGTVMPWLRVNQNGERFSNEDVPYEQIYAKDMHNPGLMHFQVFDADYTTTWKEMGKGGAMRANWDEIVPAALEAGDLRVGETLEELAASMEVPVEAFVATVERYNELCDKGYDEDFGKQAARMKKVATPPFYAFARQASCLTPLGGLEINGDMQVLDEAGQPIEGLYAAGNNSGNFFGGFVQRMCCPGFGVGRAFLTGRVAAKRAIGADY